MNPEKLMSDESELQLIEQLKLIRPLAELV